MKENLSLQTIPATSTQIQITETLAGKVADYARKGLEGSANTQRAYKSDLKYFKEWCIENGQNELPASATTLAAYVSHLADTHKWASINRKLAAIRKLHELNNLDLPTKEKVFRAVMEGIKRTNGVRQKQAPAFKMKELKTILLGIGTTTNAGLRDKCLLLVGFTGAYRRSELVSLNIENVNFNDDGAIISLSKSKTNQYGEAEEKAFFYSPEVDFCPVRNLKQWINRLGRPTGPLFVRVRKGDKITEERLNDMTVYETVKKYMGERYSAHSLRASFITIAKINGADDSEIMRQSKHKTSLMIQRYTRIEDIKQHNAATKLGL
ncbi:tyrosine-type recombinase/integrase [Runella slithyformis]|uniref:Integrase family protein n=1 Tax=Runella slithyformis (strain ATCC 29530 / DSM 19594 / LMG 11500 / NCIMB 11436 / LSU 4) TaxID=761193 RepID=A0A7U3ZRE2_RUNSL|nr:tyrosine-type recombinase/integrase [Runella slithyformis]AEI51938.1 integrase family protein [Runella slithyformis DSM 19594]